MNSFFTLDVRSWKAENAELPRETWNDIEERLRSQGVLRITVRRAINLKGADRGGTSSDPYVVLKLGGREQRTRTIMRDLNPVWEQALDFRGSLTEFLGQSLTIAVMDHDEITRDDNLGSLALAELYLLD